MKDNSGNKITWISVIINIGLGVFKCILGFVAHSSALIGDGLHSLLDLTTDIAALIGLKMSAKPQDEDHLYGHHKFASLTALFIAGTLIFFCLSLAYGSIKDLFLGGGDIPTWPALVAAAFSIALKEALFWKTRAIALRLKSRILMANAWHHRSDSISSIFVFIAIGAAMYGGPRWIFVDKVAAILIAFYLGYQGLILLKEAADDLLDTAPEQEMINDIREHILPTPGAIAYHHFRVRRTGDFFEVDLHLQVDSSISVEEGHTIASQVKKNILSQHPEVLDVLVHIEPATARHLKERGIHEIGEE